MRDNCKNKDLLELIEACPLLIEKLREKKMLDLIDAYDYVLSDCNMSFGTLPPIVKGQSWGYFYHIDNDEYVVDKGIMLKSKAAAQLAAVYDTRYKLNERIEKDARLRTH